MIFNNWEWFRIGDWFNKPYKATACNAINLCFTSGQKDNSIPYITRTDENNGCKGYAVNDGFECVEKENAITIGDTTATIFYQEHDFICGDHIVVLRSKYLNKFVGVFITTLLSKERYRYNYGRAFRKEIVENTLIRLPSDKQGNPDWIGIEKYVKENLILKIPQKAKSIWLNKFKSSSFSKRTIKLHPEKWKPFHYSDIFLIKKGKRLTKADMVSGKIPYIGAIDSNNGISAYISNDEHLHSANTISVSYNGSIAEAFYQTTEFWATDDVNVLYPKFELNKYIAQFLTTLIHKEKYRFNYGRKWDKELMEQSLIKLPAVKNSNGKYEPDWQFMEDYIKSLPYSSCL